MNSYWVTTGMRFPSQDDQGSLNTRALSLVQRWHCWMILDKEKVKGKGGQRAWEEMLHEAWGEGGAWRQGGKPEQVMSCMPGMKDVSRRRVKPTVSGRTESCPVASLTWRSQLNLAGTESCGFSSRWEGGRGDMSVDIFFRGLDEREGRKESAG